MSFRDSRRLETAIDSARSDAASSQLSEEEKARLAQIMTIWASGYLEAMCRGVVLEYTRKRAQPKVVHFVSRSLDRLPSPNMDNILNLVRRLDSEVANDLDSFVDTSIKDSVNSIVRIRNKIAHGRSTSISIGRIMEYFDNARRFARKMDELLQ